MDNVKVGDSVTVQRIETRDGRAEYVRIYRRRPFNEVVQIEEAAEPDFRDPLGLSLDGGEVWPLS